LITFAETGELHKLQFLLLSPSFSISAVAVCHCSGAFDPPI